MNTNTKSEVQSGTNLGDVAKLSAAALLLVGGLLAFYRLDQFSGAMRGVGMLLVVLAAFAIAAFTGLGRTVREFLAESHFELRKVIWPTRQETWQTTLAVGVVVLILSLVLWLIDMALGAVILEWVLKSK